ncbi:MAG: DnaJ domain-containing protein [Candidatus Poribacteria bacterium]
MSRTSDNGNLMPFKIPEELEFERLLRESHAKQNQIAELTLALEDLKLEVNRFETEYNARLGKLYVELDKVNLEINEYTLRIQLIEKEAIANKAKIDDRVEEAFKEERQKVLEYERKAKRDSQEFEHIKSKPEVDRATAKQLRKLYLKLAKIYHPDKAQTNAERQKNERMMSLINRAYEEKDAQTLRRLAESAPEDEEILNETLYQKLKRLRTEHQRLDEVIVDLKTEIENIKASGSYKLKTTVEQAKKRGEDILAKLAKDISRKIDAGRGKLKDLMRRFSRLAKLLGFA